MLTRRQARLLGLTTSEEGSASPAVSHVGKPTASPSSATAVGVRSASFTSSGSGAVTSISDDNRTCSTLTSPPAGNGIILRLSSAANAGLNSSGDSTQLPATIISSQRIEGLANSHAGLYGGRGRLGVRQAEAMLASAQRAIDYWCAASATAGPAIQLTTKYGCTRVEGGSPDSSSGDGDRGNGCAGPSSTTAPHRPPRLSPAQLRARWRGVTRNCTTLHIHARSSGSAAAAASSPPSSPSAHRTRTGGWQGGETASATASPGASLTQHVLQLSQASRPPTTEASNSNSDSIGGARLFLHTHSDVHRDMTASPEASSRRNTTYFIAPFYSDMPPSHRLFAARKDADSTLSLFPVSPSVGTSVHARKPLTALALRQQVQAQLTTRQRRLSHEVYYQVYVKAHEARMRMLFGLDHPTRNDVTQKGEGDDRLLVETLEMEDPVKAGEAAYLRSLDPIKSEEAKVFQVIASIDTALKQQLASIYHDRHESAGADDGDTNEESDDKHGKHTHGPRRGDTTGLHASCSCSPSSSSSSSLFASRRPAIVEAVIASTTRNVEAFVDQLLPYQQEGVRWALRLNALEHMNGILADDMGLGKTAQTVVYLSCYKDMVETQVQRPLEVMRARHMQLCQRALGLATPVGVRASAGEGDGVAEAELPPWLAWCTAADTAEDEGGLVSDGERAFERDVEAGSSRYPLSPSSPSPFVSGEASPHLTSGPANALLTAACSCGRMVQLIKEVKRWLWQLDDEGADTEAERRGPAAGRGASPSHSSPSPSSPLSPGSLTPPPPPPSHQQQQHPPLSATSHVSPKDFNGNTLSTQAAVNVISVFPLKRRRGRPPKHLTAMMAAANAAAASASLTSPLTPPLLSSSQSLSSMMAQQCRLSGCSPALEQRLDHQYHSFRPVLIIAPLSTLPHWAGEFNRFSRRRTASMGGGSVGGASSHVLSLRAAAGAGQDAQDRFTVYVLNGARSEREKRMSEFLQHTQSLEQHQPWQLTKGPAATPVLVIPHDMLTKPLSGPLRQISRVQWHVVVIDEAQRIKSAQSLLFKKVCQLSSISRLVLTGTPLQNNTTELFSLLRFLCPHSFTSASSDLFEQLDSALVAASRSSTLEDRELHLLLCRRVHRLLMPFVLRREKTVLKTALPPIRDYAVLCPLLPFQVAQLEEVKRKQQEGTLSGNPHIQYRKILLHPYTTQDFFYVDEAVVQTSGKLLVLDFMMRFLQRTRHKFLIFCGWTLVLDVVETLCGMRGIPYVRLDGKTSVEKREANINGFNRPIQGDDVASTTGRRSPKPSETSSSSRRSSRRSAAGGAVAAVDNNNDSGVVEGDEENDRDLAPAPCCFLISKVAGGVGLNLQAADTVFLLDVDYNPQRDAQALSRVYRVGQTREVRVFRLVVDHPIERNIVAIHEAKENLGRAVVQAGRYDLHSSVQEREEALQHIFRSGTFSHLSQRWSLESPTTTGLSAAMATWQDTGAARTSAVAAATMDDGDDVADNASETVKSDEEEAKETDEVAKAASAAFSHFPAAPLPASFDAEETDAPNEHDASMSEDWAPTPTDLTRVSLPGSIDPAPSALKKLKTEATAAECVTSPSPPPHRSRRHISFKLEGDAEDNDKDNHYRDGASADAVKGSGTSHSVKGATQQQQQQQQQSLLRSGAPGSSLSSSAQLRGGTEESLAPAARLLAMRGRLEEVLLRHDGERGVLQDMFRSLEASVAVAKQSER
jgi:hypothetical protein